MIEFKSLIQEDIKLFIKHKRAAGFPYKSNVRILGNFDKMIYQFFPNKKSITRDIIDKWITYYPCEHPNNLLRRITPIRQLAKFIASSGKVAYIPPSGIPSKSIKYTPYIYTEEEISRFFLTIDNYSFLCSETHKQWAPKFVLPIIFRVYYCLGLRNSEARMLHRSDVNLITGEILIRESKGWRSRKIVASFDLIKLLTEYDLRMEARLPNRDMFFPNEDGTAFSIGRINLWFRSFLKLSGLYQKGVIKRIHDFRHTHCVHLLNTWVKDGKDLNALYPYMSEHLGHRSFKETDYYLSLTKEFYPEIRERIKQLNEDVLPEVNYAEE